MALEESNLLSEFHTSIASFPESLLDILGRVKPLAELQRRQFSKVLKPYTHQWPWYELGRHIATKARLQKLVKHETGFLSVDSVYHNLDRGIALRLSKVGGEKIKGLYAYEDGALHSFSKAKLLNIKCLYDLPIGYWRVARKLLTIEQQRWPHWSSTLTNFLDSAEKLAKKDEELRLADIIFVASSFTAETLNEFPEKLPPVRVIPYGYPHVAEERTYTASRSLRILFVGGLSQRKGIADLFAAVDTFGNNIKLTIVGRKTSEHCPPLDLELSKHSWIPSLPHYAILQLMRQQDVLIFPSLFEGFGLVITEAMSQGTPVITTERTAGPDLIRHGENGWLTEAGNIDALRESIELLLNYPKLVVSVGQAAKEAARQRPWKMYGHEMTSEISKFMNI